MSMTSEVRGLDRHQWSAVAASFLGWTLDAFDFFLMVFMFKAIAAEFHADIARVVVASTLTLAARPFGALVFGMVADSFGRRPVLIANVVLYSGIELASAFAPTLAALLILRALFGFAMGGVWGVGASLALESIPPKARGLISGLLQEGYAAGYLIASAVFFFLFDRIGWRGMLIVGAAPALLGVFIQLFVRESPAFEARRAEPKTRSIVTMLGLGVAALAIAVGPATLGPMLKVPALTWIYAIDVPLALAGLWFFRSHWRMALYVIVLMTAFNMFSHGTQDLYPTFLQKGRGLGTGPTGLITIIGNVGAIGGGLLFGGLSERFGRRRGIVVAALLSVLVIPLWAFSHGAAMLAAGAFVMQFMVQGAWGIIPAHLNELSPGHARGAFPGYAYQVGNLLASGNAVWQAQIAEARHNDYGLALAIVAAVSAVAIAAWTIFGPERRAIGFAER
ncbi:MAG TPA: MFS transporter [Caulobacteraceae bacterium]|nr:MFS transporter [Caulobacteraceae bacterium]